MSDFTFNGVTASSMGLVIEKYPVRTGGKKHVETVNVPGRFGGLTLRQKRQTYENCTISYEVYYHTPGQASAKAHDIFRWLSEPDGFARLSDTYDPDVFRRARYVGDPSAEIFFNNFGRMTITFECDARSFLTSGETPISRLTGTIQNDYLEAYPLIVIEKSGNGLVTIAGQQITVYDGPVETIHIDSESMTVPYLESLYVSFDDFPTLKPGSNAITGSSNIDSLTITPRWYKV